MNDQTDAQLLQAYAQCRSEPAFAEIVRRHIDLVHSAAMRMVCDSHLAQDVTQNVFVALADNAAQLSNRPVLSGWLHRTAQNIAAQTVRTDVRRRQREQEVAIMNELLANAPQAAWQGIAPHLDAAIGELEESDRDALLLRYFEKKSAHEMAGQLGISGEAAQKRVSRAVERLREFFAKRGLTVGASGLAVVISANAVQAAPVGLAVTISTAAALTGTTLATTATVTATKTFAMTALQKTIVTATIAVLAGAGIYEARQTSRLRSQVQTLQQQQAEQSQALQNEKREAADRLATLAAELESAKGSSTELLRLRGEIARLRSQSRNTISAGGTNGAMESAAKDLLAKVDLLKQRIEKFPERKIPEIEFLTLTDWFKFALEDEPKVDSSTRAIMNRIRMAAKAKFAAIIAQGLRSYAKSNANRLPENLGELKPYFESPVEDPALDRYQLLRTGNLNESLPEEMLVSEKGIVDNSQDSLYSIGLDGYTFKLSLGTNVFSVGERYYQYKINRYP